jgi:hypothetical protein
MTLTTYAMTTSAQWVQPMSYWPRDVLFTLQHESCTDHSRVKHCSVLCPPSSLMHHIGSEANNINWYQCNIIPDKACIFKVLWQLYLYLCTHANTLMLKAVLHLASTLSLTMSIAVTRSQWVHTVRKWHYDKLQDTLTHKKHIPKIGPAEIGQGYNALLRQDTIDSQLLYRPGSKCGGTVVKST